MNGRDDGRNDVERFARVKVLFVRAAGLPAAERAALLARECEFEPELRKEVEELLDHDEAAGDFLAESAVLEPLPAGEVRLEIPGFRLLEPLGMGASGVVHRAVQERPRREVAIKVLRLDTLVPGQVARFQNEAEILARLAHPGIAQVFEAGVAPSPAGQLPWIAMELVRGRELTRWVREARPAPREVVGLFVALCEAVQHAHTLGIVHRDLKPSNVLVTAAGQPKVLDFGIARALVDERATAERTRTGLVMGTLAYMAPEQARGATGAVGPASDAYALGVMLFEALAGRLPLELEALDVLAGVRLVCEGEPLRLRSLRPELSADLETILLKALEKDPLRRYASAGALGQDLGNWLADRPVLARRPTIAYQARKFVRRNRALTVSAAVVILALSVALLQTSARLASESENRAHTSRIAEMFSSAYFGLAGRLGFSAEDRREAEALIASLEEQVAADPGYRPLRHLLASALHQLGNLLQSARSYAEAEAAFRRSLAVGEALAADDPDDVQSLTHLSTICAKLGEVRRDQGDPQGWLRWFEEALARDEALVARFPDDLELREDLGWSLERLAEVAVHRKDEPTALALRRRRLADAKELVRAEPDSWKFVRNLSHTHYFLAGAEPEVDHVGECLRLARRELELRPGAREALQWLCEAQRLAHRSTQDLERGFEHALAALEAAVQLMEADPHRFEHLWVLRLTGTEALATAGKLQKGQEAREILARVRTCARLATFSPGLETCARLMQAEVGLLEARLLAGEGDFEPARELETKAWAEIAAAAGVVPAFPSDLELCVAIVSTACHARGDLATGLMTSFFAPLASCKDPTRRSWLADALARAEVLPEAARKELAELRAGGF